MLRLPRLLLLLALSVALPAASPGLRVTLRVHDLRQSRAAFEARYAQPLDHALAARGLGRVTIPCALPHTPDAGTRNIELVLGDRDRGLAFLMAYLKVHPLPAHSGMAYLDRGGVIILCFTGS